MTRSTSWPVGSRISRRRQVRACRTSSEGGWPWKGTLTTSTRKPRRARLSRSSATRISAPPVTNGAWTAQTRTDFIHRPPTLSLCIPMYRPPWGEGTAAANVWFRVSLAVESLLELGETSAQLLEGVGVGEAPPFGLREHQVDALHEVVDVGDQLLLQDQVALVGLAQVPAYLAQHLVVVPMGGGQARVDVGQELVVELDLPRVERDLRLVAGTQQALQQARQEARQAGPGWRLGGPERVHGGAVGRNGVARRVGRGVARRRLGHAGRAGGGQHGHAVAREQGAAAHLLPNATQLLRHALGTLAHRPPAGLMIRRL